LILMICCCACSLVTIKAIARKSKQMSKRHRRPSFI
jgi:hypothetical protein